MKKAIFLDRDGTLVEDKGYVHKIEDFKIYPDVVRGLKLLKNDYIFFIITNQPGIGKGMYTVEDFYKFNNHLVKELEKRGIIIERTYFCPHVDGCDCKKPSTKFIKEIVAEFPVDLTCSWVVGDHPSDVIMGKNAGCKTAYLLTGHGAKHFDELKLLGIEPTVIAHDFLSAVNQIRSKKW